MQIKNTLSGEWSEYDPVQPDRFCWLTILK